MPKPKKNRMSKAEKQEIENRKKAYRMECRALEEELEEENRNTNFYEQERERVNYIWMTQKRKIEDLQADLLDKQKEREDLEAKNKIYYAQRARRERRIAKRCPNFFKAIRRHASSKRKRF